jgi:PAS domain S-box-containing protein
MFDGFVRGATECGLRLIVYGCRSNEVFQQIAGRYPLEHFGYDPEQLAGTILFFCQPPLIQRLTSLSRNRHPCVLVGRTGGGAPHIIPDDEASIRAVVRRLHRNGHRRIGFLTGPADNACGDRRFLGYRLGLADMGLPIDHELVFAGGFSQGMAFDTIGAALKRGVDFTALIAGNDDSAIGALQALKARGIDVPSQVELVGYDNVFAATLSSPPLTTFQTPVEQMSHAAVMTMARLLRGEAVPPEATVPSIFVNRGTTRFADMDPVLNVGVMPASIQSPLPEPVAKLVNAVQAEAPLAEVLAASRGALMEAIRLDADIVRVSAETLGRAAATSGGVGGEGNARGRVLAEAQALVLETNDLTRIKAAEHADVFTSMTSRLRGLALETFGDAQIVDVIRQTLGTLGFSNARLYLNHESRGAETPPGEGVIHVWDLRARNSREEMASRRDLSPTACAMAEGFALTLVLPLIAKEAVLGNLIVDGSGPFRDELAELERHITGALHSSRLYRELARGNETLRQSEYLYSSLVRSLPQIIVRKDREGRITYANDGFGALAGRPLEAVLGRTEDELFPGESAALRAREEDRRIIETGQSLEYEREIGPEGERRFLQIKKTPLCDATGVPSGVQEVYWDITSFRETEARLRNTQRELMEVSRRAGIAEMATGVLHNIGNALNSVNTSSGLVTNRLHRMKIESVGKLRELLERKSEPWSEIFSTDERGRMVLSFVESLDLHLRQEREKVLLEMKSLRAGVDHVNGIVASQQEFAQASDLTEEQDASEAIEYALRLCEGEFLQHQVVVIREYLPAPRVRMDRHKAVQILVNLLRNAREALVDSRASDRRVHVGVRVTQPGQVQCFVSDNGAGIAPEHLARVFTMGFTTKKDGHGFGLHNSMLTATSMGGELQLEHAGPGGGATFVLSLPRQADGRSEDRFLDE